MSRIKPGLRIFKGTAAVATAAVEESFCGFGSLQTPLKRFLAFQRGHENVPPIEAALFSLGRRY
jgi:hypothetical protein